MAILIVDDSPVNLKLLSAILKRAGYDCVEARDGNEAVERAMSLLPDLIILDIMMPEKDGFEACRELKAFPKTREIPIIFLSALGEVADKVRGLELGAEDYITKPFDRAEVVARVRTQLRIRDMTRSLRELNKELTEKQEKIRKDLRAAGEIQRTFLPRGKIGLTGLHTAWLFEPSDQVGGDIFNIIPVESEQAAAVFMLDVSGHGVPAALVSASVSQTLSLTAGVIARHEGGRTRLTRPVDVLEELEREYPLERFDKYFTMVYLVLDARSGRVTYSNAGHPAPILLRRDGSIERLEKGGPFIGLGMGMGFEEAEVMLRPGDRLVMVTDGVHEHSDPKGNLFGLDRLDEVLLEARALPIQASCSRLLERLTEFGCGSRFSDDVSFLIMEFQPE